jgi:2-(1,2-epoxy-1,2-dihydrophenyl)acetyl-CoA isomerase
MNIEDFRDIVYEKEDNGLVKVTINQVKRKNALSPASFLELWWAMEIFEADEEAGVMILTGAENSEEKNLANHAFSSGGYFNPAELNKMPPELADQIDLSDMAQAKLTLRMAKVGKPIIAALNGYAIGGAFTMCLSGCDLIYMADSGYIKMPFVSIAIVPEFASTYIIPRLIGMQKTKELFYFGKEIKPEEAKKMGLINDVLPHDELMAFVHETALKLVPPQGAGLAVRQTKRALNTPLIEYYENALKLENEGLLKAAATQDFFEGMVARKEKRAPVYKGA